MKPIKILSTGQPGAERAALEWAFNNGAEFGGWRPTQTSPDATPAPKEHKLREIHSNSLLQALEWNVWESDAALIFTVSEESLGFCSQVAALALKHNKPLLRLAPGADRPAFLLAEFVRANAVHTLNVTGSQESAYPEIAQFVDQVLTDAFVAKAFIQDPQQWTLNSLTTPSPIGLNSPQSPQSGAPDPAALEELTPEAFSLHFYRALEGDKDYSARTRQYAEYLGTPLADDPDRRHLQAASNSLLLGNSVQAAAELAQISVEMRTHPSILFRSYTACMSAGNWELAAEASAALRAADPDSPIGWLTAGICLDKLGRTKEAYALILSLLDRFPTEFFVPYNLACLACRLGNRPEAWEWLQKAFRLASLEKFKLWALSDTDLEPMRDDISKLCATRLI
jgi:tetratricopeptide (TPR) repeat protein